MGVRTWFREFKEWLHDTFMYFLIGESARSRPPPTSPGTLPARCSTWSAGARPKARVAPPQATLMSPLRAQAKASSTT